MVTSVGFIIIGNCTAIKNYYSRTTTGGTYTFSRFRADHDRFFYASVKAMLPARLDDTWLWANWADTTDYDYASWMASGGSPRLIFKKLLRY